MSWKERAFLAGLLAVGAGASALLAIENGLVNAVIWQHLAERQRRELLESRLMAIDGRLERVDGVQHLIATRLENLTALLGQLSTSSRDFH